MANLDIIRVDINLLHEQVVNAYSKNEGVDAKNEEIKRLWFVYETIRIKLVDLDTEKFSSLRKIELPKPNNSIPQAPDRYFKNEIEPLHNEVIRLSNYYSVFLNGKKSKSTSTIDVLDLLTNRFHRVVRQLRERYGGRPALRIEDEYDFQYLLHSLLNIYFDDIRPEEWTPSYAGSSSRVDFLLKNEKTIIELKKTRDSMKTKDIGEQLIIDIDKYRVHPDCKCLYCFIYDPEARISNPRGLENDLSRGEKDFNVLVKIRPII